jgi:hypothetical protein
MSHHVLRRRASRQQGLVLLDVLVGVFILALIASGIFSLLPAITRSQEMGDDQAKATQLAMRMVEQLQQLKVTELTPQTFAALNLVDAGQAASPYSFKDVALDSSTGYSPAKALRQADARFWVVPIDSGAARIDVQITWKSASGRTVTHKTGTIIGGYK